MKTKYASQIAPKPFWKNAVLLAITALALVPLPSSRGDEFCNNIATTHWINPGTGDWFDPLNWVLDVNGQHGVPSPVSPTYINNGGKAYINTTDQTATACHLVLGDQSVNSGALSVDDGTLHGSSDIDVGRQGVGTLTITNGGLVTNPCCAYIADLSGSTGSVSVDGQNQQGTKSQTISGGVLYVGGDSNGAGGTGLLTVTNGGIVTAGDMVYVWKSGTLTGNATVSTTNGTVVDGTVAPNGGGTTLTIAGALQLDSGATTQCNVTPQDPSSTAQVSVSGQVSLGGRLSVTMTGDFSSAPTRFTLLYADSVAVNHVKFDSTSITYPTNQCWTPQITYVSTGGHYYVYLDRLVCTN